MDIRRSSSETGSCGTTRMRFEGVQMSTKVYNGVSLQKKKDFICAVVTVRLINPLPGYDL
jgi:hypothetical protein